ncbi:MAG: hypothetical protein WC802_02470 [Patescibacteria group bacterium]|jgi:hypothetical protein
MALSDVEVRRLLADLSARRATVRALYENGMALIDIIDVMCSLGSSATTTRRDITLAKETCDAEYDDATFARLLVLLAILTVNGEFDDMSEDAVALCREALEEFFHLRRYLGFIQGSVRTAGLERGINAHAGDPQVIWFKALLGILKRWGEEETASNATHELELEVCRVCILAVEEQIAERAKEASLKTAGEKPSQADIHDAIVKLAILGAGETGEA